MYYLAKAKFKNEEMSKNGNLVEKTTKSEFLVVAESVTDAETKVYKHLDGTMMEFEVTSVTQTKIEAVLDGK